MKIQVSRTAMIGGGLAYDVEIPCSEVPEHCAPDVNGNTYTRICSRRGEFFTFEDATQPIALRAMPVGLERWEAWKAHVAWAEVEMLRIAQAVFPELEACTYLPQICARNLPVSVETSASYEVEWEDPR